MSDTKTITYTMRELAELLVKDQGLTEGKWMLSVEFGFGATNSGPDNNNLSPTAMVPLTKVGLKPANTENNLTVDATKLK